MRKNNIGGNYYPKHTSRNPIIKFLMGKFHRTLFNLIEYSKPLTILEVGCGEGYTTELIKRKFPHIHIEGSDIDHDIIQFAKNRNLKIPFQVQSVYELNRKQNSFDVVLMLEVLEHLEYPEKAISEVKKVSRNHCIFSVPNEPYWHIGNMLRLKYLKDFGNTPGHINHWSKKEFLKLTSNNFNNVIIKNSLMWNFTLCND